MAGSVNKVILVGNLGKDPEVRQMQDGREIANLTLATSDSWNDKNTGERRERTEWHRVAVFSPGLVKVAKNYLRKGSKVYIEGALQTRKWQDQQGADRYTTEVVLQAYAGTLTMLDGRRDNAGGGYNDNDSGGYGSDSGGGYGGSSSSSSSGQAAAASGGGFAGGDDFDDDIPF